MINKTEDNIGVLALEENWHRTVDGILSIEANARLYIDQIRDMYAKEELDDYYEKVIRKDGKERVWIHSHLGVTDIDEVFSKLRFMIIGCNCKWIILDHLHMMVSSLVEGDERRTIDNIMTRLRSLVEETGCGLILVSHLRKLYGTRGHEEGSTVGLGDLRGSQSIAQLSDCVIAIERNQQSEDPIEANTTHMKVLKSRYTGDVGVATHLVYNGETGRLSEVDMDIEIAEEEEEIPW